MTILELTLNPLAGHRVRSLSNTPWYPTSGETHARTLNTPTRCTGAIGKPVHTSGLKDSDILIENLRKSVTFAIMDDPIAPLIIGKAYQDKFIESINCKISH